MPQGPPRLSAQAAALVGLAGLASAMGIGRFAFTPLLPLMQEASGITLVQGGSLAAANYLGYLLGATACMALHTGDLSPPNSDAIGLFPGLPDTEALTVVNACHAWLPLGSDAVCTRWRMPSQ